MTANDIKPNHRYLVKTANFSSYHEIIEWHVVETSVKATKLSNGTWIDKNEIVENTFSQSGYVLFEDLGSIEGKEEQ